MSDELAKIVAQIPRANGEAELPGDFPLRDQPAGKIEDVRIPYAEAKPEPGRYDGLMVESLTPKPMTEADYAERKRKLPPLSLMPKRGKARFNTFDHNRRDMIADRARAEQTERAKAELAQAVAKIPMRWDRG